MPLLILLLLSLFVGGSFIYLSYYVLVKFSTSFKNTTFFIKLAFSMLFVMALEAITYLVDPGFALTLLCSLALTGAGWSWYYFGYSVNGSYNLKIFRLERDIEKLEAERSTLMKKLGTTDPEIRTKLDEIETLLEKEKKRLESVKKEKILLLSDMNVSKIKKRFVQFDSPLNTEDEKVQKAKIALEDLKNENEAYEEINRSDTTQ